MEHKTKGKGLKQRKGPQRGKKAPGKPRGPQKGTGLKQQKGPGPFIQGGKKAPGKKLGDKVVESAVKGAVMGTGLNMGHAKPVANMGHAKTMANDGHAKTMANKNMAPNFYVMDPGSPAKKMDTPGNFSYKASSVLSKLGFVDSGINDGHAPLDKKVRYDEFGTEIPEGFKSSTGQDYEISASTGKILGEKTYSGAKGRGDSPKITSAADPNKPAEFRKGDSITRTSDDGNKTSRTTFLSDTKKIRKPGTPTSTFQRGKQYLTETDARKETLKIKPYKA